MTSSQHMVHANGLRFRTIVDGPASGDMAILLHGFPEGAESWSRQVAVLAGAGVLAVAPDMRGYGLSDAPPNVEDYALANLIDDVAAIIKAFGQESAHVAGHDWGALVAWYFASRHPEMTTTLTVLSVGHPTALRDATRTDEDQKARSRYVDLFLLEGKAEEVLGGDDYRRLRGMFGDKVPGAVVESYVRSISRPGRLTAGLNYYRANLSGGRWGNLDPVVDIPMPATLLWGDQDVALGRFQAEETARHVAGRYRLEVLEGAGHWLQFERPDEVGSALVDATTK